MAEKDDAKLMYTICAFYVCYCCDADLYTLAYLFTVVCC